MTRLLQHTAARDAVRGCTRQPGRVPRSATLRYRL